MKFIGIRFQNASFTLLRAVDVVEDFETGSILILQGGKHEL
jgi:hypothetical protein